MNLKIVITKSLLIDQQVMGKLFEHKDRVWNAHPVILHVIVVVPVILFFCENWHCSNE
jgi:hypothetical protein